METYSKIMEKVWLVAAILALFFAAYKIGQTSFQESGLYLVLPFGTGVMAYLRYYTRKRLSKYKQDDE